jgi:hypothetical protein
MPRCSAPILLLILLLFISACSTPSWFPIKKGPPHLAKSKELVDKDVVLIDKQEYVKVVNPKASEGAGQAKYTYVPVKEYLAKKDSFILPGSSKDEFPRMKEAEISTKSTAPGTDKDAVSVVAPISAVSRLKRKALITHFDDRTPQADETFGDWAAEKLIKEVNRRSLSTLFVDFQLVRDFLNKRQIAPGDLATPATLHLLNEVFGIHAVIYGTLSGPYVFTTKTGNQPEETASAIIKIEMNVIDTFSGRAFKTLSAANPLLAAKERGTFSQDRAKIKAIDFTIADLSRSLARELEGLNWFCRIAKVEGDEVFLNAGKLTGLKAGDVLEIVSPEGPGGPNQVKGKVRISAFIGIDASVGRLINGTKPDSHDILTLAKREGALK